MRSKILWVLVGLSLVAVLGAGALFGLQWRTQQAVDQAVAALRARLPSGATLSIDHTEIGLFDRSVGLSGITLTVSAPRPATLRIGSLWIEGLDPAIDQAIRFDHAIVRDVEAVVPDTKSRFTLAEATGDGVRLPVETLTAGLAGIARWDIGAAALSHAAFTTQDGGFDLDSATVTTLQQGALGKLALGRSHATFPDDETGPIAVSLDEGDCTRIRLGALADGSYLDYPAAAVGGCRVSGARVAGSTIRLAARSAAFTIDARNGADGPVDATIDLDALVIEAPALAALQTRLGIPAVTLSLHAVQRGGPSGHGIEISDAVRIDHAGDLLVEGALGNLLGHSAFMADPYAAAQITIGPVRIAWTDQGLVPVLEAWASEGGAPAAQFPARAEAELRDRLKQLGVSETTGDWPAKLALYLRKPGRIELTLSPVKAVQLRTLLDQSLPPAAKFGLLQPKLTVEAAP